ARLMHVPVLASDIDPVAARVAAANAKLNGVADAITTVTAADLANRVFRERGRFDLIVANILAGPLMKLARPIRRHLAASGTVILSGLLPGQGARVIAAYRRQGLRLANEFQREGWLTLVFERRLLRRGGRPLRALPALHAADRKSRALRR